MIPKEKKLKYWNHFTSDAQKSFRPKKVTNIRLKQIKSIVFNDDFLWEKDLARYHALDKTPAELKETSLSDYELARSNFWTLIREKISQSINKPSPAIRKI
jgi:TPP-dependent pyruvate/acetoin dehydrogenase alpha subunit